MAIERKSMEKDSEAVDPDSLLALARAQFAAGRDRQAQTALMHLMTVVPERADDVVRLGEELSLEGDHEGAFGCVEVAADAALLAGHVERAAAIIGSFVQRHPHAAALVKLIEVCTEAGMAGEKRAAQTQLADAYVSEGQWDDARPLAEALLAGEPDSEPDAVRLRTVLAMLGVEDVDLVVGLVRAGEQASSLSVVEAEATSEEVFIGPSVEIDLSDRVEGLGTEAGRGAPAAGTGQPDIESVFAGLRATAADGGEASIAAERYAAALVHLDNGRIAEGVLDLQAASRSPLFRFHAAGRLGRLHLEQGDLRGAVEWLERAAEMPQASASDDGYALLYELADALDRLGESARAVAVLVELETAHRGYRDVPARLEALSHKLPGASS